MTDFEQIPGKQGFSILFGLISNLISISDMKLLQFE